MKGLNEMSQFPAFGVDWEGGRGGRRRRVCMGGGKPRREGAEGAQNG